MTQRVMRTDQAEADLVEIFAYIAEDNPIAAEQLLRAIGAKCDLLAESPDMGRMRPEVQSTVRSFPISNYVIFYQQQDDGILVLRVLHAARDINAITFE